MGTKTIKTGKQLRQWRQEQGLTLKEVANKLGYKYSSYISELEAGGDAELSRPAQNKIRNIQDQE